MIKSAQLDLPIHVYDPDCLKLKEIVQQSVRYAATITLKPRMYQYKAEQQYDMTYPDLIKHLECNGFTEYTIIAELTKNYNIHYHMTITFKNIKLNNMKKFVDTFRKSQVFGFVNIKQIDDEPGWQEYISKQFEEFKQSTDRRPVIKDKFNYYDETIYAKYGTTW